MTGPLWDQAELTDAESGRLRGARGPRLTWPVPYRIELDRVRGAEVLRPELPLVGPGALPGWPDSSEAPRMLERFLRLGTAPSETILIYARRFGLLGLGTEGEPPRYRRRGVLEPEPVAVWRAFADQARAMLNVGARLRMGESGRPDDWLALLTRPVVLLDTPSQAAWDAAVTRAPAGTLVLTRNHEEQLLSELLGRLVALADIRPRPSWRHDDRRLQLPLEGEGLLGALVKQLVSALAHVDGLGMCSACGEAYVPTRRPAAGRRHYCLLCQEAGYPQRDASAAYRGRQGSR